MDFSTPKRRKTEVKPEISALQKAYPHDLQLYKTPPTGQISLDEFQELAIERQKVLQLLEATLAQQHKTLADTKLAFTAALKKEGYNHYARLLNALGCASHTEQDLEARRRDHVSHFVLRLAYSLNDDLQKYFLTHETEFFKLRFSSMNKEGTSKFLSISGLNYSQISESFKEEHREYLFASYWKDGDFENMDFYELPFEEVVDLVADRKVYLKKGIAYVPHSDLSVVFVTHYRSNLFVELHNAKKFVVSHVDDERLQAFFKSLPEYFSGMTKVIWSSETTPISMLDDLSQSSYPLCMRIMHEHLKTNHHLRNVGRMQYGLFLKGIGVTMDDSIEFWKRELLKKEDMNDDKFNKQYLYHIKYNYGKMGRRVNYSPYGCNKLILDPVGPGEVHGCPYKHMDVDELTKKLSDFKISPADTGEITRLAREGHYILACTKYFESTHKQPPGRMFMHPNQYYVESRAIQNKGDPTVLEKEDMAQDLYMPASPEMTPQPIKIKAEADLNTSSTVTPVRSSERKTKPVDRKSMKMDPVNIAEMLEDDSD
ncbi:hypothetical protein QAD02_022828 [Eretmocerus hayati]|uniref:Uncharacterized protein n=1 Tax=Eretmocerus hayati TaxID=131215 RepID=A0ACC2PWL6_9HYME|nr:hypothetical protein QAD02_022828 [Eretmocerus hayati]